MTILRLRMPGATLLLLLGLASLRAAPQATARGSTEIQLQAADAIWLQKDYPRAIAAYEGLLLDVDLPAVVRPLLYLRLARVQMLAERKEACRKTLAKLEKNKALPRHHRMAAAELRLVLDGRQAEILPHTQVPSWPKRAATIHVSSGAKAGDGTAAKPWGSVQEALAQARDIRANGSLLPGPIEILLLGTVIEIQETIRLTKEDSGTQRNPLLLRGASPTPIVLSGGAILRHWAKVTDSEVLARLPAEVRGHVLVAEFRKNGVPRLPALELGGFSSTRARGTSHRFKTFPVPELFYEGEAQPMARWPNKGNIHSPLGPFKIDRPLRWVAEKELWLHGYWHHMWADAYEKVQGIDVKKRSIQLVPPTNRYGFRRNQWHAVNALSELDQVGEWHFDSAEGKIRYLPPEPFDPGACRLSCYGPILEAVNCQYLVIQHVDFGYVRGDCLILRDCSDFTLSDCRLGRSSGYGLMIEGGRHHLIMGCKIQSMGRGGIDIRTGDRISLKTSASLIENCEITDLSRIDRTYTPALLLEGIGVKVRYCKFELIPSSAIRVEGNDMLIELNEFTRCVWESDDQGAIDMWGNPTYRGNVIRWNSFHDNVKPKAHYVAGVRLDDAICGTSIYENLFINTATGRFGGTQIHGGKDNYIEGNLFVDCKIAMSQTPWGKQRWEKMLSSHPSIEKSLSATPWQSPVWSRRYPSLASLLEGPVDQNFFIDNLAIHAKTMVARKSTSSLSFNNRMESRKPGSVAESDIAPLLRPWHPIPWRSIGPYGNKR